MLTPTLCLPPINNHAIELCRYKYLQQVDSKIARINIHGKQMFNSHACVHTLEISVHLSDEGREPPPYNASNQYPPVDTA